MEAATMEKEEKEEKEEMFVLKVKVFFFFFFLIRQSLFLSNFSPCFLFLFGFY